MPIRINIYVKNEKVKKVEINLDGIVVSLDPRFIVFRSGKPVAIFNPISGLTLPLNPEYTTIINK